MENEIRHGVMSIHKRHAQRILSGDKVAEFRRVRPNFSPGSVILIYETKHTKRITGFFVVSKIEPAAPELVDLFEVHQFERELVQQYLQGSLHPTAMVIAEYRKFENPLDLTSIGVLRAPQSYQFITSEKATWATSQS